MKYMECCFVFIKINGNQSTEMWQLVLKFALMFLKVTKILKYRIYDFMKAEVS